MALTEKQKADIRADVEERLDAAEFQAQVEKEWIESHSDSIYLKKRRRLNESCGHAFIPGGESQTPFELLV